MHSLNLLKRWPLKSVGKVNQLMQTASISVRTVEKPKNKEEENSLYPRKIFSGIQPTGQLHLGNYLGAIQKWIELQNNQEDVTYCIVDMHSITIDQNPAVLRENIFEMAATMYACGLNPEDGNLFVQSSVKEHSELCWILNCLTTMARLGHLPQFKEKSRKVKDVPLGLYVYPVLQAADIMLYKATHVPVGEDQLQHIQLTQHLTRIFNTRYGQTFPICHAMIDNQEAARIRSLRNPAKKMSKSDPDTRATISIRDEPDVIVEKIKKAVTDFTSDVTYDPANRPGVSNLVAIHSLVSGTPIEKIIEEARTLDTGRYKLRVAEAVVEHLKPIKAKIDKRLARKTELIYMLEQGAEKARQQAQETLEDVKQKMGLGIYTNIPQNLDVNTFSDKVEEKPVKETKVETTVAKFDEEGKPIVPKQKIRLESRRSNHTQSLAPAFEISLGTPSKLDSKKVTQTPAEQTTQQKEELPEKSVN
ncbi:tryptophan--tRNA ligase, mitochondrial-like [Lucilia sericata]|uniref:tryptophan--tRNA ligase, mitochondrial-like n=1 Tax=Lucilia sericata TaxID=13632 RepID=UPI0018A8788D|nr:tryptophan--tRNA ligase, mitochondrial-like [Lucilia sericata]